MLSFGACSNDSPNSNSDSLLEYSSEGLIYDIDGEEVTIVVYNGDSCYVEIPNYIEGFPVTKIGEEAFEYSLVVGMKLPKTLEIIDRWSFHNTLLRVIVIPKNVKEIRDGAFASCYSLQKAIIGDGVVYIGESAFSKNRNLIKIEFGKNLEVLDDEGFYDNTRLSYWDCWHLPKSASQK